METRRVRFHENAVNVSFIALGISVCITVPMNKPYRISSLEGKVEKKGEARVSQAWIPAVLYLVYRIRSVTIKSARPGRIDLTSCPRL